MKPVADPELGEALAALDAALGRVVELGVEPVDHRDAITVIKRVERAGRRMDSVRVGLVEEIEQRSLHAHDGHHSAKVMVRHVAKLSSVEAARRAAAARALRELPELRAEYERGDVGTCQVRKLSNLFANKRVREQLITDEKRFIHLAKCESFKDFELRVGDWERLVDEDGTADKSQANHENRDMRLVQEFDGGWLIKARCGSLQGAQIEEILAKFIEAELFADFDRAKALYGDDVSKDKLERSDAQTRLASCYEIFLRAASSDAKGTRPTVVTNIVLDHAMFERELAKLFGQQVEPVDPWDLDFRSRTLNGRVIDSTEATVAALLGRFKRVVVNAAGVTVNMSRDARFFTGNARLAVQLGSDECTWPGCHVPVTQCQIDHMKPWAEQADGTGGGCTCPENGAPACGRHNRHKQLGYTVYRDQNGHWHTIHPDGTEIE